MHQLSHMQQTCFSHLVALKTEQQNSFIASDYVLCQAYSLHQQ